MPQATVAALHSAQANDSTRTRLARSASQPTGIARQAVEEREIQPADQPQLAVGDAEFVLDRLRENRQQLPIQEVQHVDETEDGQRPPAREPGLRASRPPRVPARL